MKVYVVNRFYHGEHDEVIGVFKSPKKARKYIEAHCVSFDTRGKWQKFGESWRRLRAGNYSYEIEQAKLHGKKWYGEEP